MRDYASVHHMVRFTDHAKQQMENRDITRRMVLVVLEKRSLSNVPKWNTTHATWEGKVQGIAAGSMVSAACAIADDQMVVTVVTVHPGGR